MNRTRIVRWLRVILPLAALAILSTLFLLSRKPGSEPALPYTETEPGEVASGQRITAPEYAGVTDDGAAISLSAARAIPAGDTTTDAQGLRLTWRARDGLSADLAAPEAAMGEGRVTLSGGVRMTTSSGWILTAPEFRADTAESRIEAPSAVRGKAPFGDLSAGAMTLTREGGADDHVLNFTDGVRLLYQP
ncbi:hypothetical protein MLD63_01065 (plasmid) [Paracoccus sp. TK19116]|uniref:Lipopolysaccharide export system protein LptC n=1 Tax=Paracoccus albicereus TaxID=2922394 RepID=A0ABT1ML50_9RHOB|nr:hypothetical protein [Paracoccus albicereus]MCQ0969025.1 hypothetical protein [Paracoccus albicereus]